MHTEQLPLSYEKPISFFDVRDILRRMWMVVSVGKMKVVLLLCKTDYSSDRVQLLKSQRLMVWLRCVSLEKSEPPRLPNSLSLKGMCCTGSITFSLRNSWYRNPVPVVDNEPQNWEHSASPCNDLAAALRGSASSDYALLVSLLERSPVTLPSAPQFVCWISSVWNVERFNTQGLCMFGDV